MENKLIKGKQLNPKSDKYRHQKIRIKNKYNYLNKTHFKYNQETHQQNLIGGLLN